MRLDHLRALNEARAAREPIILVTDTASGEQRIVRGDAMAADQMSETLEKALRAGKSETIEHDGKSYFLTVQAPPVRIIIIGAVHISQALAPMGVCGLHERAAPTLTRSRWRIPSSILQSTTC